MTGQNLTDEHHIVRQVPWARQLRGDLDEFLGITHHAFTLRESHKYLSVAWCEYFSAAPIEQLQLAISQLQKARRGGAKAVYWKCSVGEVRARLAPHVISAFHAPIADYECHAGLGDWPEDATLLEALAKDAIAEVFSAADFQKV
jgi:hypothetical protein